MALTGKKKKFADAVIAGKSNKDAAIAAGYSAATAAQAGSRLVKDEDVSVYIVKRKNSGEQAEIVEQEKPRFDLEGALLIKDPIKFLIGVMNDPECDMRVRADAAKAMLPYTHKRMGEAGKKEEAADAAKKAGNKFSVQPPPLKLVGGNK